MVGSVSVGAALDADGATEDVALALVAGSAAGIDATPLRARMPTSSPPAMPRPIRTTKTAT